MSIRIFGFDDTDFDAVSDRVAEMLQSPASRGEDADWGEYFWFVTSGDVHHHLVENMPPPGSPDLSQSPEPDFLHYHCILYMGDGPETSRLGSALRAIGGKLLVPHEDLFYNWHTPSMGGDRTYLPAMSQLRRLAEQCR